jgi:peptide/nickel transport system substrate-binding protein
MRSMREVVASVVFLLVVSLLGLASVSFAATPAPRYGGVLRISDQTEGASIGFPAKMPQVYSLRQAAPAIETLLRTDKTGKSSPWLATKVVENANDKTIVLTLRQGVKFHDGTDFNADSVKWNLDIQTAAKAQGSEKIKSVEAVDSYTVRINLTEWDSTVSGYLSQSLGMIISPAAYKKNGEEWCAKNPIGTGPFQFVSWDKDVKTVYKKFPGYWLKGKPYVDSIEFILMPDSQTRLMSLRVKEISIGMTMAAKDVEQFKKDGFRVTLGKIGVGADTLVFDSANPKSPFSDIRVRRAAQYAVDTGALIREIYKGVAEPTNQWAYKGHWSYEPSVVGYPYNPQKAKQLLKEAGYPNGFKTKLMYRTTPTDDMEFTAIQGFLKAVEIDVQLDPILPPKYTATAFQGGTWEGLIQSGHWSYPDATAGLAARYNGGGQFYNQMLVPDDYSKAIKAAVTAKNFAEKQKYTRQAIKLMIDKYCLKLVRHYLGAINIIQPYVHNDGLHETSNSGFWTPEEVWLEN